MSRYTNARRGAAIIKVDLKKACDRLEWSFIESTLEVEGVPRRKLAEVIMRLVSTGSRRLLWNGEITDEIKPSKGLRQGDPFSLYLFELCMERLGHWFEKKVRKSRLKPLKAARRGQGLSYLLFADDLLLSSEVVEDQLVCLREGLELFYESSGQKVNYNKSSMLCSMNVPEEEFIRLSNIVGVPLKTQVGMYLGHQMLHGERNRDAHRELLERVKGRLEGWKVRCLSRAGIALAQTLLGSFPIFQMQFKKFLARVHRELDKANRNCVWAKHDRARGMHLINWETVTKPKSLGGENLKVAQKMNWALLANLASRLLKSGGELSSEMLKAKYKVTVEDGAYFMNKQRAS